MDGGTGCVRATFSLRWILILLAFFLVVFDQRRLVPLTMQFDARIESEKRVLALSEMDLGVVSLCRRLNTAASIAPVLFFLLFHPVSLCVCVCVCVCV